MFPHELMGVGKYGWEVTGEDANISCPCACISGNEVAGQILAF